MELFFEFISRVFKFLNLNTDGSVVIWIVTIIFITNIYLLIKDRKEIVNTLINISLYLSILGMLYGFCITTFSAGAPVVPIAQKAFTMLWGFETAALSLTFHFFYKIVLDLIVLVKYSGVFSPSQK